MTILNHFQGLKPEYREYADSDHVKKVAQKYSSFTSFPLYCEEEHINQIEPIWMLEKNKITDEMHSQELLRHRSCKRILLKWLELII